jgi:hypothetical protein
MTNEKIYKIVWLDDSPNAGLIEPTLYKELDLPDHNRDEVLGPHREFVEVVPGTLFYKLFIHNDLDHSIDTELLNVDLPLVTYNWETQDVNLVFLPSWEWDDIRAARNAALAGSDNLFNFDTPEPLRTQWVEYRQSLRELIDREIAAGRTPSTVFWNDYVPPFPKSARVGIPPDIKVKCAWYKGKNTYPPEAIVNSPECLAAQAEAEKLKSGNT